jgi:hypothetical protein
MKWFLLGLVLGAGAMWLYNKRSTVKTVVDNQEKIKAGISLVDNLKTIFGSN